MKKRKNRIGSMIIGILLAVLIGYTLNVIFPQTNSYLSMSFYVLSVLIFAYQGYIHPIFTETLGFAIPVFILAGIFGNLLGGLLNLEEIYLAIGSVSLIILNLFIGNVRYKSKKGLTIIYRTTGVK